MEQEQVRVVVKIHPKGGMTLSSTDMDQSPMSNLSGKATAGEYLVADLISLGLKTGAEKVRIHKWPKKDTDELVLILPKTEILMKTLGFTEIGEII